MQYVEYRFSYLEKPDEMLYYNEHNISQFPMIFSKNPFFVIVRSNAFARRQWSWCSFGRCSCITAVKTRLSVAR